MLSLDSIQESLDKDQKPLFASETKKIAIIGAGAFGTCMAAVAGRCGHEVLIYCRDPIQMSSINETGRNPKYLSQYQLPKTVRAVNDLKEALENVAFIMLCIPAQSTPNWLLEHRDIIPHDALLCNTAKGLHLASKRLLSEAIREALGRDQPYALLSGPSFAQEIMDGHPTAVVVASKYMYHAVKIQRMLTTLLFRVYTSQDVIGVELGGALKNPLAIGAGMIEGSGFKVNTMAAYVTRSSLELQELCKAMGGEPQTISGLSGVGDLMLTAFGELSRNRSLGKRITRGESIAGICNEMTVEGVPTALVAVHFADICGLDLPIFRTVAAILSGDMAIEDAHKHLMGRPLSQEIQNSKSNNR